MSVRVFNVMVHRDAMTKIPREVWAWEVPVLEAALGASVEVKDDFMFESDKPLPDAGAEFERLSAAYGGSHGRLYVEEAYGSHSRGVKALKDAITAAGKPPKKAAPPSKSKTAKEAVASDPLADA